MKLKFRVLSLCLALVMLVTACGSAASDLETEQVSVEKEQSEVVTSSTEADVEVVESTDTTENTDQEEDTEAVEETESEEPELSAEERERLEWENALIPNVDSSLNVRVEPNERAELAGKLASGDRAQILETGEEWSKIQSGNLIGYVKNEYCIFGLNALAFAKENFDTVAECQIEGLRVRKEMSTDSKIVKRLEEGDTLVVDLTAEVEDGWVAVKYKDSTSYVSEEYVTVTLRIGTGMTIEEIEEKRRAEEEAKRRAEEAKKQAAQQAAQQQAANQAAAENVDDLTLLAAIIYCEAGAEPYETQLAVGAVILNRVQSVGYPNTLRDVIYQRGQFGPARTGKLARVIAQGKATSSCYQAAQDALNGADNTGGCLYFNDYNGTRDGVIIGGMVFW